MTVERVVAETDGSGHLVIRDEWTTLPVLIGLDMGGSLALTAPDGGDLEPLAVLGVGFALTKWAAGRLGRA